MNSAGMAPRRLVRPYLAAALVVSVIVALTSAYLSPKCLRELRRMATDIRVDVVANIVQAGRFTTIERNLVFYLRERQPDGILLGIFINDRRNPQEEISVLAEQGEIIESAAGFLHSARQRQPAAARGRTARSCHRALRPLCLRPLAIHRPRRVAQPGATRALSSGS